MDSIRLSLVKWSNGVWCLSSRAVKQVSRMDRIDQMESNGRMDSIRLVLVKWSNGVLLVEHSGCKESESNGSSRSSRSNSRMIGTGFEFILEYIIDHSIYMTK